jgi:hypothetical protein
VHLQNFWGAVRRRILVRPRSGASTRVKVPSVQLDGSAPRPCQLRRREGRVGAGKGAGGQLVNHAVTLYCAISNLLHFSKAIPSNSRVAPRDLCP